MDHEASLEEDISYATTDNSVSGSTPQDQDNSEGRFRHNWDVTSSGAALFAPADLPLTRPLRAYERQPKSPFARRKVRFSKIYKRSNLGRAFAAIANEGGPLNSEHVSNTSHMRFASLQSPMKAVKKLCLSSDYGLTPQVLSWETRGSPDRKIRTRSTAVTEELMELPDEQDTVGGVPVLATLEVVDEDGHTVNTIAEVGEDWEDEDSNAEDEQEDQAEASVEMQIAQLSDEKSGKAGENTKDDILEASPKFPEPAVQKEKAKDQVDVIHVSPDSGFPSQSERAAVITQEPRHLLSGPLPAGFVSPVKRRRTVKERMNASNYGSRRRTLPVEFAPAHLFGARKERKEIELDTLCSAQVKSSDRQHHPIDESFTADEWEDLKEEQIHTRDREPSGCDPTTAQDTICPGRAGSEDADGYLKSEDLQVCQVLPSRENPMTASNDGTPATFEVALSEKAEDAESTKHSHHEFAHGGTRHNELLDSCEEESTKSSKDHSPLAIRRSPRRKSTSPLKKTTCASSIETSHLVAFTPVKRLVQLPLSATADQLVQNTLQIAQEGNGMLDEEPPERCASAPPEDPLYSSPKKQPKPRVSDDTALLQAFLDRAAERKIRRISDGRGLSIAKRESIENRRDSGTVREALAANQVSPPEVKVADGILTDRDINSPSPKKLSPAHNKQEETRKKSNLKTNACKPQQLTEDLYPISMGKQHKIEDEGGQVTLKSARRSARDKRNRQASTLEAQAFVVGPNKISVRGNADPFVLKRTDAQELALLTRNNTRKNKGGAILPQARLMKLATEEVASDDDCTDRGLVETDRQGRLTWREVLVEYSEAPSEPVSELFELSENGTLVSQHVYEPAADGHSLEDGHGRAPAPCDTPSKPKPKIRRLRPPRTAATHTQAGHLDTVPVVEDDKKETETEESLRPRSATVRKRSRIATPAKKQLDLAPNPLEPPTSSSLADLKAVSQISTVSADKGVVHGRRKVPPSRLPAPPNLSAPQTKETTPAVPCMSSPPKKKPGSLANAGPSVQSIKTFAPQLDLGSRAQLKLSQDKDEPLPGLMSPAKKANGRRMFAGNVDATTIKMQTEFDIDERPGLSSPAKKRSTKHVFG